MSWRVRFEPYGRKNPRDCCWEDWSIKVSATDQEIMEVADEIGWESPLKLYVPEKNDGRLSFFQAYLQEKWSRNPEGYSIYYGNGCE